MQLSSFSHKRLIGAAAIGCATALAPVALAARVSPTPPAAATSTPQCATSGLVVWLDTAGSGTAGGIYYKLRFTNLTAHACTLSGYPGVSAVNLAGHQLGSAAQRNAALRARVVRLARTGSTATAVLKITEASVYPSSSCRQVTAAGLRVYPPGQTTSKLVPFPFGACSRSGPLILHVEVVTGIA
jgi:uncharacterized protein DUF4232